jgi:hypothetical protein
MQRRRMHARCLRKLFAAARSLGKQVGQSELCRGIDRSPSRKQKNYGARDAV